MVDGATYTVAGSSVTSAGAPVTDGVRLSALELAYALTLVRRSPILDLEGTDPEKLRAAVTQLATSQKKLSDAQTTDANKAAIQSLYPISFLNALTDAEAARQQFIASGSDKDEQSYQEKLLAAIAAGKNDVASFSTSYRSVGHPAYALAGGVVQGKAIQAELQSIQTGFSTVEARARARAECIAGSTQACDTNELALDLSGATTTASATHVPQSVYDTISLFKLKTSPTIVYLTDTDCISSLNGQPYYLLTATQGVTSILYAGDAYFTRLGDRFDSVFFRNLGVSYLYYNPIIYYSCFESPGIIAQAEATQQAAQALGLSGQSALDERSIQNALRAALQNASSTQQHELLKPYLMLQDSSAGFDQLVYEIGLGGERLLGQSAAGIGVDTSAKFYYDAKSGFYALFLASNPSAGSKKTDLYAKATVNPFASTVVPWSTLRTTVSVQSIQHDLHIFFVLHLDPSAIAWAVPKPTPPPPPPQIPAGTREYKNDSYLFSLDAQQDLTVSEQKGAGNSLTVLFGNQSTGQGFQVFVIPYGDAKITPERFKEDEPSGVMNSPANITIDGAAATEFQSTNQAMGATREIWFIHNGLLYEVTAPISLDSWLLNIMKTWKFL